MNKILSIIAAIALTGGTGCATVGTPTSGPSTRAVHAAPGVQVIELTMETAREAVVPGTASLADLPEGAALDERVGSGDLIEVTIWEAAPAALFGGGADAISNGRTVVLPAQTVGADGHITVPFAGRLTAAGRATHELEADIVERLRGKANSPQAIVRNASNRSKEVTVIGQVRKSQRLALSPKGERVLDAIATAGGPSVPVEKATVQLTRAGVTASTPLQAIVQDPQQNVVLSASDIVAVYFQPKSFVSMGAVGKVGEIEFEATGLTLAEAIARVGGPIDARADAKGVFVARTANGDRVVYRLDLRDPASLFVMREFQVEDEDVIYVANAPSAELQKFLSVLGAAVYPLDAVRNFGNSQ